MKCAALVRRRAMSLSTARAPSAKSESLSDVLARIPARSVLYVEVGAGDLFGTDYSGKSQVANIVLSQEGGVDGNVKVTLNRLFDGSVIPDVQAAALIRSNQSSFNLSAGTGRSGQVEAGLTTSAGLPTTQGSSCAKRSILSATAIPLLRPAGAMKAATGVAPTSPALFADPLYPAADEPGDARHRARSRRPARAKLSQ